MLDGKPLTKVNLAELNSRISYASKWDIWLRTWEYRELFDLNMLKSAVATKSATAERGMNNLPRIAECTSGMLNSISLEPWNESCNHWLPALRYLSGDL